MGRIGYIGCVTYLAHSKLACQIFAYTCINRGVRLRGWGGGVSGRGSAWDVMR